MRNLLANNGDPVQVGSYYKVGFPFSNERSIGKCISVLPVLKFAEFSIINGGTVVRMKDEIFEKMYTNDVATAILEGKI